MEAPTAVRGKTFRTPFSEAGESAVEASGQEGKTFLTPFRGRGSGAIHLDSILLQACLLAAAFGIGLALQAGVVELASGLDRFSQSTDGRFRTNLSNLPLFFFALVGGWILRLLLQAFGFVRLLDREMIHRLCGISMDVLIVTSLARMSFALVGDYLWPVLLMIVLGSAWALFCLVWVSPRILPRRYWFELGLINYGFSTAATAQGMMFLRLVDPALKSGAAETYALGAPLTAPFIGGGVITFLVLPPLIGTIGSLPVAAASTLAIISLYFLGIRLQTER